MARFNTFNSTSPWVNFHLDQPLNIRYSYECGSQYGIASLNMTETFRRNASQSGTFSGFSYSAALDCVRWLKDNFFRSTAQYSVAYTYGGETMEKNRLNYYPNIEIEQADCWWNVIVSIDEEDYYTQSIKGGIPINCLDETTIKNWLISNITPINWNNRAYLLGQTEAGSPLIPDTVMFTTLDNSTIMPTMISSDSYMLDRDGSLVVVGIDSPKYYTTTNYVEYRGSRGSNNANYIVTKNSNGIPTNIKFDSEYMFPTEGYDITGEIAGQRKMWQFTHRDSSTTYYKAYATFGNPSETQSTLSKSGVNLVDGSQNVVLTFGNGFVGYSGEGFPTNTTYKFVDHRGETFTLWSNDGTKKIQFMIGGI